MKSFLITIDTEGDNLWEWHQGNAISTENSLHIPRFQSLCNQYGFKPVYLTNYEMALDKRFVAFAKKELMDNSCEIGMHLHAWNTPPYYTLLTRNDVKPGAPYLIEYPLEIQSEKVSFMTELIKEQFEIKPDTHRAGRWAMNHAYFELLNQYGYLYDCSVTPMIDWSDNPGQSPNSMGSDYSNSKKEPSIIKGTGILEIPVTVEKRTKYILPDTYSPKAIARSIIRTKRKSNMWLRPNKINLNEYLYLLDYVMKDENSDYIMFMLHSSEFMPGGSPTFKTDEDIELLFKQIDKIFRVARDLGFEGKTIKEYGDIQK